MGRGRDPGAGCGRRTGTDGGRGRRPAGVAGLALAAVIAVLAVVPGTRAGGGFLIDLGSAPATAAPAPAGGGGAEGGFVGEALGQLARGCDPLADRGLAGNPYADSVLGRAPPPLALDAAGRRALIAATLSQDPAFALAQTAGLRAAADPGVRYVGWLVPAYVTAKAQPPGDLADLEGLLAGLAGASAGLGFSTADLDYLRAVVAAGRGDADAAAAHIERAVAREPQFFNAILFGLRLEALRAEQGRGWRACERAYAGLFRYLLALVGLTRCPLQAAQSELYLRRMLTDPEHAPSLLAARVYLGLMARKPALAAESLARFDALAGIPCRRAVSRDLHRLVARAGGAAGRPGGGGVP